MRFVMILVFAAVFVILAWWQFEEQIPRHWHPGETMAVDDPLTPVTKWKLRNLSGDREGCLAVLETVPEPNLRIVSLPDHEPVEGCPLENVVRVHTSGVEFNESFMATCPLALAWIMFERQILQPAAETHFGSRVDRVNHYGSFACRYISGREDGRLSEHASAEALDVSSFRLADGRLVSVRAHWGQPGEHGEFLRDVRDGACDLFGNVLGPDYNPAHADHFHFGMRGYRLCR